MTTSHDHAPQVRGLTIDDETRCTHYNGPNDVVALKFKCCGDFYPCYECHAAAVTHPIERWIVVAAGTEADVGAKPGAAADADTGTDASTGTGTGTDAGGNARSDAGGNTDTAADAGIAKASDADEAAVLCGVCGQLLSINEYLRAEGCPTCEARFNPGCSLHHDIYFDLDGRPAGAGLARATVHRFQSTALNSATLSSTNLNSTNLNEEH